MTMMPIQVWEPGLEGLETLENQPEPWPGKNTDDLAPSCARLLALLKPGTIEIGGEALVALLGSSCGNPSPRSNTHSMPKDVHVQLDTVL